MKSRVYLGAILVEKLYAGDKTIDWVVDNEQGQKLAKMIAGAAESSSKFDLNLTKAPNSKGKYRVTVTYSAKDSRNL